MQQNIYLSAFLMLQNSKQNSDLETESLIKVSNFSDITELLLQKSVLLQKSSENALTFSPMKFLFISTNKIIENTCEKRVN